MRFGLVVDTSALVAMARGEPGYLAMRTALVDDLGAIPTPVLVEYHRVTSARGNRPDMAALTLIDDLAAAGTVLLPFGEQAAYAAVLANERYGTGNGHGGVLNMLDLMVYAMAQSMRLPILCTGRDFAATDAAIHPASRIG